MFAFTIVLGGLRHIKQHFFTWFLNVFNCNIWYCRSLHTIVAVHCHSWDIHGVSKADDELLRKHAGRHPKSLSVSRWRKDKQTSYVDTGPTGLVEWTKSIFVFNFQWGNRGLVRIKDTYPSMMFSGGWFSSLDAATTTFAPREVKEESNIVRQRHWYLRCCLADGNNSILHCNAKQSVLFTNLWEVDN